MPESAEVRRLHNEIAPAIGFTVEKAEVLSGRYARTPIPGFNRLIGYSLHGIGTKGKLLIFSFKSTDEIGIDVHVLSTLGMTGWWHLSDNDVVFPTKAAPEKISNYNPKHARLRLWFQDRSLIFTDTRNFGTFKVTTIAGVRKKLGEMGPDIAINPIIPAEFWPRFEKYGKNRTIAEVMLDQRVFCGVGNYMRADALYLARIDPQTPALELTKRELGSLWTNTAMVGNAAFQDKGIGSSTTFFTNVCYGRKQDRDGNPIEAYEDRNGRTVWWCPAMQARRK